MLQCIHGVYMSEIKVNKIVIGEITGFTKYGIFVKVNDEYTGMVHISELNTERVEKVTDIVKEGDEIIVKCLGYDKRGRLNFSRKEAINVNDKSIIIDNTPITISNNNNLLSASSFCFFISNKFSSAFKL